MDTGLTVTHPLTGAAVPLWVGNYVLMSYGDGAVMGVPAHDERDFAFALKYGIPIHQVIADAAGSAFDAAAWQDWYATKDGVCVNSIPISHCEDCGAQPVPEQDLPVVLPQDLVPDGSGNPLNKCESFLKVACPCCGKEARRETDTMDTFIDSSWYFMRYCDPQNSEKMVADGAAYWMAKGGMDQYIGGIEHAILHLLYARFWTKVMRDLGLLQVDEPFKKLLTQGMVLNHIYSRRTAKGAKEYFWPKDVEHVLDAGGKVVGAKLISPQESADGLLPVGTAIDYEGVGTMSKSKNNGVDPQDLIEKYGADTARLYTMFTAPPEATLEWNDAAVEGSYRFLRRVWNFAAAQQSRIAAIVGTAPVQADLSEAGKALRRELHMVLGQIQFDYDRMQYNTVVSGCMKLLNALEGFKTSPVPADDAVLAEGLSILLRTLYPACPHITAQLWQGLGYAVQAGDLLDAPWPQVDEAALVQDEIELMLQVNGKLRGALKVPAAADKAQIEAIALASEAFAKHSAGQTPKKIVVVPGRLVNLVV